MKGIEFNKIAAAILTAGVIAMLFGFGARLLIPKEGEHGGHDGPNLFADLAPVEATGGSEPKGPEPIAPLMASASAEAGESVAKKCASCHTFAAGEPNKVGPNLHNIVGAKHAAKDFAYSQVMQEMPGNWGYEELSEFLYKPTDYAPGTKMSFPGLKDAKDRADIIAYLRSMTENPPPLPEPEAEAKPAEEGAQPGDANTQPGAEGKEQPTAPEGGKH
jgi:cytochrome c